jgi:hypothetical protein
MRGSHIFSTKKNVVLSLSFSKRATKWKGKNKKNEARKMLVIKSNKMRSCKGKKVVEGQHKTCVRGVGDGWRP